MTIKKIVVLCTIMMSILSVYAEKNELRFRLNRKFKIVQFTDMHFIHNNAKAKVSIQMMDEVLEMEKPDLVMLTGDIIYGRPAKKSFRAVLDVVSRHQIPFAVTFGNHDDEYGQTKLELFEILKTYPLNLTDTISGLSGVSNFYLSIKSALGRKEKFIIYAMDSHAYSKIKDVSGYDYIKEDQIEWYKNISQTKATANRDKTVPAIAFFHIPLPEFHNASAKDNSHNMIGIKKEAVCAPQTNSGLFQAIKEEGGVQGIFVGHDHNNDFAAYWQGILLAYGRYSGGDTVYNNLENGARVIEIKDGEKGFETWIRLKGDVIINKVNYPKDFEK